jgi:hypothetical protein
MYLYCILLHRESYPVSLLSPCIALISFQETLTSYISFTLSFIFLAALLLSIWNTLWRKHTTRNQTDQAHICLRDCANRLTITGQKQDELKKAVGDLTNAVQSKLDNGNANAH